VTAATPDGLKKVLGGAAYLVTGLTKFTSIRPAGGRVTAPGLEWEGTFLVLAVGNGRQAGGGYKLCPQALINNGMLDVRIVPELPAGEIPAALSALLGDGIDSLENVLVSARVPWVQVDADEPLQINLDGEPIADSHFRFEILPGRLKMKLPADCPLLG
jgi:diacylglycerol kinase family enzyme